METIPAFILDNYKRYTFLFLSLPFLSDETSSEVWTLLVMN